jgi:hypothetical protein
MIRIDINNIFNCNDNDDLLIPYKYN